jgi:hypothetical protein
MDACAKDGAYLDRNRRTGASLFQDAERAFWRANFSYSQVHYLCS